MYKSCSAFAPIANPSKCPWGEKAFKGYFGEDNKDAWAAHDATELVKSWKGKLELLIDVVRTPLSSAAAALPLSLSPFQPRASAAAWHG